MAAVPGATGGASNPLAALWRSHWSPGGYTRVQPRGVAPLDGPYDLESAGPDEIEEVHGGSPKRQGSGATLLRSLLPHSSSETKLAGDHKISETGFEHEVIGFSAGWILAPYFSDGKMEKDYTHFYVKRKLAWGRTVTLFCSVVAVIMLAVNIAPPYDESVWWRRGACLAGLGVFSGLYVALHVAPGEVMTRAYDCGIVLVALLGTFASSMTADRTAKLFHYAPQTWTLVALQEANASLFVGMLFCMCSLFCKPDLSSSLVFYCIAIPMYVYCPLAYGSKEYEIMSAAREYQYDWSGKSIPLWPHEATVLVRACYLVLIAVSSHITTRGQEVQQRSAFAMYYITKQKLDLERQLKLQAEEHAHELQRFATAVDNMKDAKVARVPMQAQLAASYPHVPGVPWTAGSPAAATREAAPNGTLALAKAAGKGDWHKIVGIAQKIPTQTYGLRDFFDDCASALPELGLFAACGGESAMAAYQQTIGALFSAYWLLRLDSDGPACLCYGVDEAWHPKPAVQRTAGAAPLAAKSFFRMTPEEKRTAFLETTDWPAFAALVAQAGCKKGAHGAAERVAALLCVTVLRGLMKVKELLPTVQQGHGAFRGFAEGVAIADDGVALAYVLERFPGLLPSYSCLPHALQKSVFALQGAKDFNFTWLVQAEAPPANLSGLKAAMHNEKDCSLYLLHWFAELAGAEATPLGGAEKLVLQLPHTLLASFLSAVPLLAHLPQTTETDVTENYLRVRLAAGLLRAVSGSAMGAAPATVALEDASAGACLRLITMAQGDMRIIESLRALTPDDQNLLQVELSRTGCAGQKYRGCTLATKGGPALCLPGGSAFLQTHTKGPREHLPAALRVLMEVHRCARTFFPVKDNLEGTKATVSLTALKGKMEEVARPSGGDIWLLVRKSDSEVAVECMRATRINELRATGVEFQMLDFGSTMQSTEVHAAAVARPIFHGKWKCIDTWGMDEFLQQHMGVGKLQRMAAAKAPWPSWVFVQDGDLITFTNNTAMGELREKYMVDGPAYSTIDGYKREIQCKATWEGDVLVIVRTGPEGRFREERSIEANGHLKFRLSKLSPEGQQLGAWGRNFERSA